jgi:hypothetical protein
VAVVLAVVVVFGVLQLGVWMMADNDVPLLRMHWMKLTVSGSGDHGEDPRSTCHKVLVSSRAMTRFISSKTSLYAMMLSQILVWRLFTSFYGAATVATEDKDGCCSGEAQVSPRAKLLFFFMRCSFCKFV